MTFAIDADSDETTPLEQATIATKLSTLSNFVDIESTTGKMCTSGSLLLKAHLVAKETDLIGEAFFRSPSFLSLQNETSLNIV